MVSNSACRRGSSRTPTLASQRLYPLVVSTSTKRLYAALLQYKQANIDVSDTRYGLAAAYLQKGDSKAALAQLTANEPDDRVEPPIIQGEAARISGNFAAARSFFNARYLQVNALEALDWAWGHLNPPITNAIELGSGLDMGYVRGFYAPEKGTDGLMFRWSSDLAEVRRLQVAPGYNIVWSGWRPGGLAGASPIVTMQSRGNTLSAKAQQFALGNDPAWVNTGLGSLDKGTDLFGISVTPFVGSGSDPRLLGVQISSIEILTR